MPKRTPDRNDAQGGFNADEPQQGDIKPDDGNQQQDGDILATGGMGQGELGQGGQGGQRDAEGGSRDPQQQR